MTSSRLAIDRLCVRFGQITALDAVTSQVRAGAVTCLLGPNAAGKSTLLRAVTGVVRPTSGQVTFDGRPVHRKAPRALAAHMAYVPQHPHVSAALRVRDVVELGRYAIGEAPERVAEALEATDLAGAADRPVTELSGGQQQRVALARALAQLGPGGVLVLDEPTSAMDMRHVARTIRLLRDLASSGVTVMTAIHDLVTVGDVADEVWLMDAGRLVRSGAAQDVLRAEHLEPVFGVEFDAITRSGRSTLLPRSTDV